VVVTVTTTQRRADNKHRQPQIFTRQLFRLFVLENIITINPVKVIAIPGMYVGRVSK